VKTIGAVTTVRSRREEIRLCRKIRTTKIEISTIALALRFDQVITGIR
jgi:hypothetical protein